MDGYDSIEVLAIIKTGVNKDWVLDLECSFHLCLNKTWFETLEESNHGVVLLGNNKCFKVMRSTVRIRMFNGMEKFSSRSEVCS